VEAAIKDLETLYKIPFPVMGKKNIGTAKTQQYWKRYNKLIDEAAHLDLKHRRKAA
jgi:hypothetical protein